MLKKLISALVVVALGLSALSTNCFAEEYNIVYDEAGNSYEIPLGTILVVIKDMYGNVVNVSQTRSDVFYDESHTIPPHGTLMTYKYESHVRFFAGFMRYSPTAQLGTDPNKNINLTVYKTAAVNNLGIKAAETKTYNTSTSPFNYTNGFVGRRITADEAYPYYYAVYENLESTSVTLHLIVGRDTLH